jgi:acetyltransferase-like isoleucine patch superfamily enzyme
MRLRLLVALMIALVPANALRILLYRRLLGYEIGLGCRIGMLNLIACRHMRLGASSTIGRGNVIRGAFALTAGHGLFVGNFNVLSAPDRLDHPKLSDRAYAASIEFGDDCLVNDAHYLDGHGRLVIGDGTWVAGRGSQFFTHGVSVRDRDISIGRRCFIGSAARFAPGSGVGDGTIVGIGSVVVSRIAGDEILFSGFPAQPIRSIAADLAENRYRFSKADWVDSRP